MSTVLDAPRTGWKGPVILAAPPATTPSAVKKKAQRAE